MNDEKKKKSKVTVEHSAEIRVLYQHAGVRGKKLYEMFHSTANPLYACI